MLTSINQRVERDSRVSRVCPKIKDKSWGLIMDILVFRGQGIE
jgi:hypothetical protein